MVLDGVPILMDEVDADIDAISDIDNAFVENQRRRLILINIAFPRAYARAHFAEERKRTQAAAEAWYGEYLAGDLKDPIGTEQRGNWDLIGLDVWLVVRQLQLGETSAVVELPGRFVVVQLLDRDQNERRGLEQMLVRIKSFTFVDSLPSLSDAYLQGKLEIVDPAWHELVPGFVKYKMGAAP